MRITKSETRQVTEEITADIICNKCGNSCRALEIDCGFEGLLEVSLRGGYGSFLGDDVEYTFSVCEKCIEDIMKTFKLPPKVYDHVFGMDCAEGLKPKD